MTRPQLDKSRDEAVSAALELVPHGERTKARKAVEHAYDRGLETLNEHLRDYSDQTACAACKSFLSNAMNKISRTT